jgi:hypothetical protein
MAERLLNRSIFSFFLSGHAYAILDFKEIGDIKLIQLRNPWSVHHTGASVCLQNDRDGMARSRILLLFEARSSELTFACSYLFCFLRGEGEWTGDWGDGSEKWTQKMRTLCNYPETSEADGIFYMAFEDFVIAFQRVYICRVFDHIIALDHKGEIREKGSPKAVLPKGLSPWYSVTTKAAWKGPTAAGHVCHLKKFPDRKPELNPQWTLRLTESRPAIVFLTLTQPTQTGGGQYLFISLLVLKKNGLRAREVKKSDLVGGNTKCRNSREICAEVALEPGVTYTVQCSTYEPGQESEFALSAFCRYGIALQPLSTTVGFS